MSTIPHKHVPCINFEKLSHLKNNELSKPQFHKVSKGVSKIVLKFPHKVIFRTRNYETLLLAILLFIMVFWKSPSTWSLAATLDNLVASIPLPASQVETVEVESFLSSQGSRIVNMENSSIVYSFLVRAHNLQILRIEQGSTPRVDQSFLLRFSLLLSQA
jgi:hypothetical protein